MTTFPLVSPDWLKSALDDPSVVILDATYHLPTMGRDARSEFEAERIPGARFFDIDEIKDSNDPLPHMIPDAETFRRAAEALGVTDDSTVVCYDSYGLLSAARAWWMFRLFGFDRVSVLDGGLKHWKACGYPTESGPAPDAPTGALSVHFRPELVRRVDDMLDNLKEGPGSAFTVLDARSAGRFAGTEPEPRAELRAGHIPNSLSLPSAQLTDPETGRVKTVQQLQTLYEAAGIELGRDRVVTSCGSGVTACALAFGLFLLGDTNVAVYDGSWSEWGARDDTPVETGVPGG
ncbi:3-mercaptopyruvate sulfurtransferase [Marivibrio halodurans]|uniref:Sulfurtransferase n=1 Tax=Marivibrio halodurans TaxID=2039722 RepID=A0A8J7S4V7_9PROT|nr:3-mercaptopyruvate sulfurtransferase [Marivibrio halodurans]MBP5856794.1 3-mercaptopyruvate sulfurtransferase [Marivibrio halodurans]